MEESLQEKIKMVAPYAHTLVHLCDSSFFQDLIEYLDDRSYRTTPIPFELPQHDVMRFVGMQDLVTTLKADIDMARQILLQEDNHDRTRDPDFE